MFDGADIGVIIDGSFESLMTVVYLHYYERLSPKEILAGDSFQQSLHIEYVNISSDGEKSEKVIRGIRNKMPSDCWTNIYRAFLSFEMDKYMDIYKYILAGFRYGGEVDRYLQWDYVLSVHMMAKNVSGEAHLLKGLVRFRKAYNGIFYSDISPKNDVLELLAEHFSDRLCDERFIIHDVSRGKAIVYNANEWIVTDAPKNVKVGVYDGEKEYQELWAAFFDTIAIRERTNKKLQRQHVPLRFRKHMTEFAQVNTVLNANRRKD